MKNFTFLLAAMFSFAVSTIPAQNIVINELVTSNTNINTDEDGSYQDWVELYNNGPAPVNLNGYGLSDDPGILFKWVFPNVTVDAGQYLLIFCSDKNRTVPGSPLHTNFKISSSGEVISLTNGSGVTIDSYPATIIVQNNSYGRSPDGSASFSFFTAPTPNAPNFVNPSEVLNPPVLSQNSGFFTSAFDLTITAAPGTTILYTLDGSEPNAANLGGTTYSYKNQYPELPGQAFGTFLTNSFQTLQYSAPINITDRTSQPNKLSLISSTYEFSPEHVPDNLVYKGTVVRAKAIKPGATDSEIVTKNYFITPEGNDRFSLPVISLSIDENKLFDYEDGIYVAGKLFDDYRTDNPNDVPDYPIGNYTQKGSDFERVANFNYFVNGQEVLNQNIGIRIQGNYSRIYPSKSFNFYSKAEYGNDMLDYKFFEDEDYVSFKRLCVKNSGSDFFNSFFKDALCHELVKTLHTQTEASQPAITFLNGEYWGLLTIREKYDDKFFNRVYGIPESEIELLENDGYQIEEGDNAHYLAMVNYFENNSLVSEANYNYIKTQMDPESFTDYFISNIYLQNRDWPGNNIVFWRRNTAYNPGAAYGNDGRWRWAFHDVTATFENSNANTLADATAVNGPDWPNPAWSTLQLRKLLENDSFRVDFISRFADVMNTCFLSSNVIANINLMKAEIEPEMGEQMARWEGPVDFGDWNYFVNKQKTFANNRPAAQRNHIRSKFGIASNINVTLNVSNAAHGRIKINTIEIIEGTPGITSNPYPWTGIYFSDIPVKLKAIPNTGYVFSHWEGYSDSTNAEITVSAATAFSITAIFAEVFVVIYDSPHVFTVNTPINNIVPNISGGTATSFSITPGLPSGLSFDTATGIISGTPSAVSSQQTYTVTANYSGGNMAVDVVITVNDMAPAALSYDSPNVFTVNSPIVALVPNISGGSVITYSISPVLPLGLSFDTATGIISGTPTVISSQQTFTVTATNSGGSVSADVVIIVNDMAPAALSYDSPNVFTVNSPIDALVPNISGGSVTTFSISPELPGGLTFDTATGIISGTPTVVTAMQTFTVTASNSGGSTSFEVVIAVENTMGIKENTVMRYSVHPNPFTDSINIDGMDENITYGVYSVDGKLIKQGKLAAPQINLSEVANGMYILKLSDRNKTETKKIIKRY